VTRRLFASALLPFSLLDALAKTLAIRIGVVRVKLPVLVGRFGFLNVLGGSVLGRGGLEGGDLE
jgi:hypothetical protein